MSTELVNTYRITPNIWREGSTWFDTSRANFSLYEHIHFQMNVIRVFHIRASVIWDKEIDSWYLCVFKTHLCSERGVEWRQINMTPLHYPNKQCQRPISNCIQFNRKCHFMLFKRVIIQKQFKLAAKHMTIALTL